MAAEQTDFTTETWLGLVSPMQYANKVTSKTVCGSQPAVSMQE